MDTLKIDRSFVKGLSKDENDSAIVRAMLTMAKTLCIDVTAEGVETDQQRLELKTLGCDRAQGYLFARPADAEHVTPLLAMKGCTLAV